MPDKTLLERVKKWGTNNPVIVGIIIFGIVLYGVADFLSRVGEIRDFFTSEKELRAYQVITESLEELNRKESTASQKWAIDKLVELAKNNKQLAGLISRRIADFIRASTRDLYIELSQVGLCSISNEKRLGNVLSKYPSLDVEKYAFEALGMPPLAGSWPKDKGNLLALGEIALPEIRLHNKNYSYVNLNDAILPKSNIRNVEFANSNLAGLILSGTHAIDIRFTSETSLDEACLNGCKVEKGTFRSISFKRTLFDSLQLINSEASSNLIDSIRTKGGNILP